MTAVLDEQQVFYRLAAALAVGLLIGVERDWKERAIAEGTRVAGVRTYGWLGLLGGGVNSAVKGGMPALVGGRSLGFRVGLPLFAAAIVGPATASLWLWKRIAPTLRRKMRNRTRGLSQRDGKTPVQA